MIDRGPVAVSYKCLMYTLCTHKMGTTHVMQSHMRSSMRSPTDTLRSLPMHYTAASVIGHGPAAESHDWYALRAQNAVKTGTAEMHVC